MPWNWTLECFNANLSRYAKQNRNRKPYSLSVLCCFQKNCAMCDSEEVILAYLPLKTMEEKQLSVSRHILQDLKFLFSSNKRFLWPLLGCTKCPYNQMPNQHSLLLIIWFLVPRIPALSLHSSLSFCLQLLIAGLCQHRRMEPLRFRPPPMAAGQSSPATLVTHCQGQQSVHVRPPVLGVEPPQHAHVSTHLKLGC